MSSSNDSFDDTILRAKMFRWRRAVNVPLFVRCGTFQHSSNNGFFELPCIESCLYQVTKGTNEHEAEVQQRKGIIGVSVTF